MRTQGGERVGLVGLGIMGQAYARLLIAAGHDVAGYDPSEEAAARFARLGGTVAPRLADLADRSAVLTALPSGEALEAVCLAEGGLASVAHAGLTVVEMSTLGLALKERCSAALAQRGAVMLDCPVSGTGAQAAEGQIDVFASGEQARVTALTAILSAFSRNVYYVGPFGTGTKLKLIANLLVTVHNLAAAESLLLAKQAGVDLELAYKVIRTGAGSSRLFELRGPLMIEGRYEPPTAKMAVHMKDVGLIAEFAGSVRCPTPLFAASIPYYAAALAQGRGQQDTAALFAVLEGMIAPPERAAAADDSAPEAGKRRGA
jgi:putative dehydrogenase